MLAKSVRRAFCRVYHKKDEPSDLKVVLKNIEERVFNNRMSKSEIRYEQSLLKSRVLMKDPLVQDMVKEEEQRMKANDPAFRSYHITSETENKPDIRAKIEATKKRLAGEEASFFGVGTDEEFAKRSRRFIDAARFGQIPDTKDVSNVDNEYGRFDVYKGAYATLTSSNNPLIDADRSRDDVEFSGASIHKFLRSLGDNTINKEFVVGAAPQNGVWIGRQKPTNDPENEMTEEEFNAIIKADYRKFLSNNVYLPHQDLVKLGKNPGSLRNIQRLLGQYRLSGQARLNIYQLYNKGTSIRDICLRFGIAPQRAKAVIWCQQYFFESVLPRITHDVAMVAFQVDNEACKLTGSMDYGLDLDWLAHEVNGKIDYGVKFTNRHRPPSKAEVKGMQEYRKLVDSKQKKKMDVVPIGHTEGGHSGYIIREMRVYRGHGAHRAGKMFSRILRTSHRKSGVPLKVQAKLDKGFRIAVQGFGPN